MEGRVTRRHFLGLISGAVTTIIVGGCSREQEARQTSTVPAASAAPATATRIEQPTTQPTQVAEPTASPTTEPTATVVPAIAGVLKARPGTPVEATEVSRGIQTLGLIAERDTLLYVPTDYAPDQSAAFVLLLHGAGGIAEHGLSLLQGLADEHNLLLLAPASRRQTWDMIHGGYGPDVTLINQALAHVFTRYAVDALRLAIGGFSDGASYALSLGLTNGDLFTHIMAFSPGYMAPARQIGKPRIFISHGTHDEVLPIEACSRKIVPRLESAQYDVHYREFDGPHTVPPEITQEAMAWLSNEQG